MTGSSFDYGGYFVAFIVIGGLTTIMAALYWRNRNGRQRRSYLIRLGGLALLTLLTGLRRFVIDQ
jgi:hypothetical protein